MDIENFLSPKEIKTLKQRHRDTQDHGERNRIKTILMINKGYSTEEIADILIIQENQVHKWRSKYARPNIKIR